MIRQILKSLLLDTADLLLVIQYILGDPFAVPNSIMCLAGLLVYQIITDNYSEPKLKINCMNKQVPPAHKAHKSIEIEADASASAYTRRAVHLKYGSMIGKGAHALGPNSLRPSKLGEQQEALRVSRELAKKESRLAKYFMNKLAKSKSIADINVKGLNLSKLSGPADITNYASTARHEPKANEEDANNHGGGNEQLGVEELAESDGDQQLDSQRAEDDARALKERERLLNKSQSLSKGGMWAANRFNATSYIRAKQRGNLSLGFEPVKGLRNRSFLGKEVGEDPQTSVRRKPVHIHHQQFKRKDLSYLRDESNPKNLSINSRLWNPRPLNNLSKNMSLQEDQLAEAFGVSAPQMQTDVIKERGLDGSQYENVSMGSIGSFEDDKQEAGDNLKQLADQCDGGNAASLVPAQINKSPSKAARQPVGSFKHSAKGTWETNFYTQTNDNKGSTKKLEIQTAKMARAPVGGLKRAPLTTKYAQGSKTTKHKKQSTTEFEFVRKHARDHDGTSKISAISPLKVDRASYLVRNRMMVGKAGQAQNEAGKMWRTHRASQNVAAVPVQSNVPSLQMNRAVVQAQNLEPKPAHHGPVQEQDSAREAGEKQTNDHGIQDEMTPPAGQAITYSFTNLPLNKRVNRQTARPKNQEQALLKMLSPHLNVDEGRQQKSTKPAKQAIGGLSPLTPVSVKYEQALGNKLTQTSRYKKPDPTTLVDKSNQKLTKAYPPSRKVRENKSVKNLASGPKEHKRSMTLATREAMQEQVAEAFQSIIEEPAEDNAKSNDNISRQDQQRENSQAPRVGKNSSRGPSQFKAPQSRNRDNSQAKDKDRQQARLRTREYGQGSFKQQQSVKMPRGSLNIKSEQIPLNSKHAVSATVVHGIANNVNGLNAMSLKFKTGLHGTQRQQYGHATIEGQEGAQKADGNVPQGFVPLHTRTRSFLRTTRNTIAQHGPKQGLSIPEPLSISSRYAQYQNQTKKVAERNLTFLQEFKKTNQGANKVQNPSKSFQQARAISTSKPGENSAQVTARGIPHLPLGPKFGLKGDNDGDKATNSARRRVTNASKDGGSASNDAYRKSFSNKKSLTAKKSVATASKVDLLEDKMQAQKPQINNLMIDQFKANATRNNLQKQAKTMTEKQFTQTETLQQPPVSIITAINVKQAKAAPVASQTQQQSSTNPQQPSSQLSGMLLSKSQMTTSRSPRKDEVSAEPVQEIPEFPLTSQEALTYYGDQLNDFEKQEILDFSGKIYYLGQNCKQKVRGHAIKMVQNTSSSIQQHPSKDRRSSKSGTINWKPLIPSQRQIERLQQMDIHNYGYDDENGDYKTMMLDHLGYRYEVTDQLGSGSFGQALQCIDHSTGKQVAVKIIRNKKKFQYQAGMELKILLYLNKHDKQDQNNVIRVNDFMLFREHLIISFELLSINLYEFIKNNNFQGVSQNLIRRFAIQILQALKYQHDHMLVHCDLKPENILLKQENKSGIKVIDYGSSCFMGQRIYTYIQSRFYRAPEIILGIPYTTAIDMWSFGAIIAELYTGFPLFPGESEMEQLAYIMELYGVPPESVLRLAQRKDIFFDKHFAPKLQPNSRGKIRQPNQKKLEDILRCNDELFLDFLNRCFIWDPVKRMSALEALQHPWILEGLPEKVLKHHKKMFGYKDDKINMQKMTLTEIQGFPKDKKDQSIYDILHEIHEEQRKEKQIQLARSRLESSRNNLTRQTMKTSERTSRAEENAEHIRSLKQLRSQQHEPHQQSMEVAQIHLMANKMPQTQLSKASKSKGSTQPSPFKERKSRKQRMENSELKLIHKLAQFQNFDQKAAEKQDQPNKAEEVPEVKKRKSSIKIYQPDTEPITSDIDQQYLNKLAALEQELMQAAMKTSGEMESDNNCNAEIDNSESQVRAEDQINMHIQSLQTNILNSKSQVTEQVFGETSEDQREDGSPLIPQVDGLPYSQTMVNPSTQSSQMQQQTSKHYKPKRKSQQKFAAGTSHHSQIGQESALDPPSQVDPESQAPGSHRHSQKLGAQRQASSKNGLTIKSVAVEEQDDEEKDMTPLQFKYQ